MKKSLVFLSLLAIVAAGCEKKDETPETSEASKSSVVYTMSIVSASGSAAGKGVNANTISSASVFIAGADGAIIKATTDESGLAAVTVPSGVATVTVKADNFTTLVYTVDLRDAIDTARHNNVGEVRSAASILRLYPTSGVSMCSVAGKAEGDFNGDNPGNENVPDGTVINAYITPGSNDINHSGTGRILSSLYESTNFKASTVGGRYTLTVPGTSSGLTVTMLPDDIATNYISAANPTPAIFTSAPIVLSARTGQKLERTITYVK